MKRKIGMVPRLIVAACITAGLTGLFVATLLMFPLSVKWTASLTALFAAVCGSICALWVYQPFVKAMAVLDTGIRGLEDGDFSFRLVEPDLPEPAALVSLYNKLTDAFSSERASLLQKKLMLDSIIQNAPMGIFLLSPAHVVLANRFGKHCVPIQGGTQGASHQAFREALPTAVRRLVEQQRSGIVTLVQEGEADQWHLISESLNLNGIRHQLLMLKPLTKEFRQREVEAWKNMIRLLNHELNNTLTPISSLIRSAEKVTKDTECETRLQPIFATLKDSSNHLIHFLREYAEFARLPRPRREHTIWRPFLTGIGELYSFKWENHGEDGADFDPGQIRQVLINLIKNAWEAAGTDGTVRVIIEKSENNMTFIHVEDSGSGIPEDILDQVMLPFFSTKDGGTGLGLALAREILENHNGGLQIADRPGGGTRVTARIGP